MSDGPGNRPRAVLVSGLSGAGKASILRALEDLGYEAVDNLPLPLLETLVSHADRWVAIGVDARTRGFDAGAVLDVLSRLRAGPVRPELVFAWADEAALLRRFTETRRRHPLAPSGRITDGIAREEGLTAQIREAADLVIDTSDLALVGLRQLIEQHFGRESAVEGQAGLNVGLISFAFSSGLPREADLVFDARFLRNPHYDPILRSRVGSDPEVGAYVESDPDYAAFFGAITSLLSLVLPRFVQEGKKYATIAVGCTGGRHRSVHLVERLGEFLAKSGWKPHIIHRELTRGNTVATGNAGPRGFGSGDQDSVARTAPSVQAQEA